MPAASARIGPCTAQASTPQLMKLIFLPVGIGLPIGAVTGIDVGRTAALASVAFAAARPAWSTEVDEEAESFLAPQAETVSRTAAIETIDTIHLTRRSAWRCADMVLSFCVGNSVPRRG